MARRLAAILVADLVGYSRLMGRDEAGTLARYKALRANLIDPKIAEHRGRIFKAMGDAVLVEFSSVVDAVDCSISIAAAMSDAGNNALSLRYGIHVGDVIVEGDDLFGDAVNIAARIEAQAEPGGICLSDDAFRQARGKVSVAFTDGGEVSLKNIEAPVRVWHWAPDTTGIDAESRNAAESEFERPDKPSIAVLPFDNMSGDADQLYFADGITEDIITDLSRFRDLFVIARNTTFTYRGKAMSVKEIARELGVNFVLEGSVRKFGQRVRVTAQLIDGSTGHHVWARRYDGQLADVFDLQEEVTRQVVGNIAPYIDKAEIARSSRGERRFSEAHDLAWQSYAKFHEGMSSGNPKSLDEAIELAGRSLDLDYRCGLAYLSICWSYAMQNLYSWGDDPKGAAARALEHAEAAMLALPQSETAYNCLGAARFRVGQFEEAVRDFRSAHELNPNDVRTLFALAWGEATLGETVSARRHATDALRLSPKDLWSQLAYLTMAMATFVERDHDAFVGWAEKAIHALPVAPIRRAMMIAHAAEVEDRVLLRTHLDALNRFAPDFIASLFRGENRLFARDEHMGILLDGLRKAGLTGD